MPIQKKKKINITNIVRRIIQIAAFVLVPGLFISVFNSIKTVWMAAFAGTFDVYLHMPQLAIIFAVIPITIIFGRFFCGFICSFGSMGDLMWKVARKLKIKRIKVSKKADAALKYIKYVLIAFLVLFVWTLGAVTIEPSVNPWNVFGMYSSLSAWGSISGFFVLGGLFLVLIIVGSMFIERMFCRYFCPLGAVFAIVSKLRIIKIKKPSANCGSCRACTAKCSMGIDISKADMVKSGECIDCFECVSVCPRNNAQAVITNQSVTPLAAGAAASIAIMGLHFAGKAVASDVAYADNTSPVIITSQPQDTGKYEDGVYTGVAKGYRGNTEVEVTVENGYITSVELISTDDDMEFMAMADRSCIKAIVSSQSTDVDTVSGATYSSYAIINAVANALGDTAYEVTENLQTAEAAPTATATPEITAEPNVSEAISTDVSSFADGTYTGTGTGFRGDIEVEVTVEGGKITDIEIVYHNEDGPYLDHALGVIDSIIAQQNVEVDAMSGATYSSEGIMEAVADALLVDYTSSTESGGRHRGGGH